MRISKNNNVEMYELLFEDWTNYDKWAPFFYHEFVIENSKEVLAGVMTPCTVCVNDSLDQQFISWLKEKGIMIQGSKKDL